MPTLTSTQLTDIRDTIGDTEVIPEKGEYILTDAEIQSKYDDAGSVWSLAMVYCLRRVLGYRSKMVNETDNATGNDMQLQQLFTNTMDMLNYWERTYKQYGNKPLGENDGSNTGDINTDPSAIEGIATLDLSLDSDYNDTFSDTPNTYTIWG